MTTSQQAQLTQTTTPIPSKLLQNEPNYNDGIKNKCKDIGMRKKLKKQKLRKIEQLEQ